ncbi:glycosyltransferase family 2 protein [Consotaella aegiceratis]|uniref:glycosyltransferase family 2 protein n=1 Tax=Consotaella aegiceratis TaxID=3097961 RepID=UPI002F3EAD39
MLRCGTAFRQRRDALPFGRNPHSNNGVTIDKKPDSGKRDTASPVIVGVRNHRSAELSYTGSKSYAATVIIPTYNRRDLTSKSLDSLLLQEENTEPFEVIVCDDGSSDDTFEVLRSKYRGLNLKYTYYPDHGYHVARARNMGIRLAEGEYCIFLDSGNIASSVLVKSHLAVHRSSASKTAVIGHSYGNTAFSELDPLLADYADRSADEIIAYASTVQKLADVRERLFRACKDNITGLSTTWGLFWGNVSMPTESVRQVGGYDEWYTSWGVEDIDLGLALKLSGHRFVFSPDAVMLALPHRKDKNTRLESHAKNIAHLHEKYNNADSQLLIEAGDGNKMFWEELSDLGYNP